MTHPTPPPDSPLDDDARWLAFVEPLRAFLRRRVPPGVDAEDVAQEVFLRLARHRATLEDVADVEAWIFRVARSALTDAWRAEQRRRARSSETDPDQLPTAEEDPAEGRREISACVLPFIAALDAPSRRALELTALQGLTQDEAARREGISLSGMKSRVQRARERVLREVQHCCGLHRDARGVVRGLGADEGCAPPASFHRIERRQK
ncbi:sigma-70 family RNA polymerase sigma factor [Pseudogemmatithrix spongiicola]|uniref:Sigma-70 family RNA polymerase sigma factor n=1 Tax=Pseudogemmatithrix spongiicola TaxID=3062599 RepID=A0AA49Q8E1_9BACT|nr:sigma-70 family RNA polymerase sigma factor [Gemmatimonadaceae bacterium 'strain 138']WKW15659.1 sigma-70 family RNA polymerase sigma factor [Gemmatimonadaceae bacterium 'strain 318']